MLNRLLISIFLLSLIIPAGYVGATPETDEETGTQTGSLIIYEVKLGDNEDVEFEEYITLFNPTEETISLEGWKLEYAKSTFSSVYCGEPVWQTYSVNRSVSTTVLSGELLPGQVSSPIVRSLTNNISGSLRLIQETEESVVVHDLVGWGAQAPCFETEPTLVPENNKTIKRFLLCDNLPIDSNNNLADFASNQTPSSLGVLDTVYVEDCKDTENNEESLDPDEKETFCHRAVIIEILPNPSGTDTGKEYIELHNPTDETINMLGCTLRTTANASLYVFTENDVLEPGEHKAFYDSTTGLTLANAAGGEVWLISLDHEQVVQYPPSMKDNYTWALINSEWQQTSLPTPSLPNALPLVEDEEDQDEQLAPCPEGKYRHPETKRCRSIVVATALASCRAGYERNPATNRCRSVISARKQLSACKPGQERNPETNRCRSVAAARTTACKAGYERNPSTGRCRKSLIVNSNSANDAIKPEDNVSSRVNYYILSVVSLLIVGYGIYEYKLDISNLISRWRAKLGTSKTAK